MGSMFVAFVSIFISYVLQFENCLFRTMVLFLNIFFMCTNNCFGCVNLGWYILILYETL
jgi:hypothetical protein